MIKHKYGEFSNMQISEVKEYIRKRVFFLLIVAEDSTKKQFPDIDLYKAHEGIMWVISGLNDLLLQPPCLVTALSRLEEAKNIIKDEFDFKKYRKLILDAGAEIGKIPIPNEEVECNVDI